MFRNRFLPHGEVEKYHKDIQKIDIKFCGEYLRLECPKCESFMNLTLAEIRKDIMEIGVMCSNCKNKKFLIKIQLNEPPEIDKVNSTPIKQYKQNR